MPPTTAATRMGVALYMDQVMSSLQHMCSPALTHACHSLSNIDVHLVSLAMLVG